MNTQEPIVEAFEAHDAFQARNGHFSYPHDWMDVRVTIDDETVTLDIVVPTLEGATREEEIGPSLATGWFETLSRRIRALPSIPGIHETPAITIETEGASITISMGYRCKTPRNAPDATTEIITYVEGTYVQGIVPGFDYIEPIAATLSKSAAAGESDSVPPL